MRTWDVVTGRIRLDVAVRGGPSTALAIAPDGRWLVGAGFDGRVRVWDSVTGRQRLELVGSTMDRVNALAIATDGSWLATADTGYGASLRIWDTSDGRQHSSWIFDSRYVSAVAIAPDGSWLASGGEGGGWLAINGDYLSWRATAGEPGSVRIWDAATGRQRTDLTGHTAGVTAVAIAPDGNLVATGVSDGSVRIWDVSSVPQITPGGDRNPAQAMRIPNSTRLSTGDRDSSTRAGRGTRRERIDLPLAIATARVMAIAPDGHWLVTGEESGSVRIWDASTGAQRTTLADHTDSVNAVAIAPDGTRLASASFDRSVRISNKAAGWQGRELNNHTATVTALAFAPDGSWLAGVDTDRSVRIWDAATGRQRTTTKLNGDRTDIPFELAIGLDGTWLVTAGVDDASLRIWDTATGRLRAELAGHTASVTALAIAPDDSWLASASADQSVRIWHVRSQKAYAVMRTEGLIRTCAWDRSGGGITLVGRKGLYRFAFAPGKPEDFKI